MKYRPILLNTENVKATQEERKTQTRRVYKNIKILDGLMLKGEEQEWCPYGKIGDRLWVKETFYAWGEWIKGEGKTKTGKQKYKFAYRRHGFCKAIQFEKPEMVYSSIKTLSNKQRNIIGWFKRPSLFMQKKHSRITLEITDIRVERLQDISEEDCEKEGSPYRGIYGGQDMYFEQRVWFEELWDSINANKYPWDSNPWVWVISYKIVQV